MDLNTTEGKVIIQQRIGVCQVSGVNGSGERLVSVCAESGLWLYVGFLNISRKVVGFDFTKSAIEGNY